MLNPELKAIQAASVINLCKPV